MIVRLNLKRLQISHNLFDSALALIGPVFLYGCHLDHVPNKELPTPNFKISLIYKLIKMLQFTREALAVLP